MTGAVTGAATGGGKAASVSGGEAGAATTVHKTTASTRTKKKDGPAGKAADTASSATGVGKGTGEGSFRKAFSLREGPGSNIGRKEPAGGKGHALRGRGRQLLVAEFVLCMAIAAMAPLTDRHKTDGPTAFLRRAAAICVLFLILGLVATAGKGATRIAAGLGGLVTLTLLVSDRDILTRLAATFNSTASGAPAGPPGGGSAPGPGLEGDTSQGSGPSASGEVDSRPQQTKAP